MVDREGFSTLKSLLDAWRPLIDALPYPVSVHDASFGILAANSAFREICGRDNVVGSKCYGLIHCTDRPVEGCPIVETLKTGLPARAELYEAGLKKHLLVHTSPLVFEGKIEGVIHSVMDISDAKSAEASAREVNVVLGESLSAIKKREEDLLKSREAFLNMLEDVSESYKDLEELFDALVTAMVGALDAKSPWTKGHSVRVAQYAYQISREMGLDEDDIRNLHLAGLLHDIGKMGTYDAVLDKPGRLTDSEFALVKQHPARGAEILKNIKQLKTVVPLIRHHHERIDGRGYPDGLAGENIPLGARILHVADSFDSMTADRPYRPSPGKEYAISELTKYSGTQFEPGAVKAFLTVLEKTPGLPQATTRTA